MEIQRSETHCKIFKLVAILMCLARVQCALSEVCSASQWTCDDGTCIDDDLMCDGVVHCADHSDETAENCIHLSKLCPHFGFLCSYGACVSGVYRCNNIQNCADNSDELICVNADRELWRRQCGSEEMQCLWTEECIGLESICNGRKDCSDGSDETVAVCAGFECSQSAFHCGYGGCVDGTAKCNGAVDCADGSDEAWELCGTPRRTNATISLPAVPTTPSPPVTLTDDERCQIPSDLIGFRLRLHPSNDLIMPGEWLEDSEIIHIECIGGVVIDGPFRLLCESGKFSDDFPICHNYCNTSLAEGISTVYHAYDHEAVDVTDSIKNAGRMPHNYTVKISCAIGYRRKENSVYKGGEQRLRCLVNGEFDVERESCVQNCGRLYTPIGYASKSPWHMSIFVKEGGDYTYICSGSAVSPRIVLSAAHCFWDNDNRHKRHPEAYKVVAGKYSKAYNSTNDGAFQMRDIEKLHIPEEFKGANFADIVVIKLKMPLVYNENVSSICLPTGDAFDSIKSDLNGTVTGYGETNTLEQHNVKTLRFDECKNKPFLNRIAKDKFCLSNMQPGAKICRGDSGSGFAMTTNKVHHLWAIISFGAVTDYDCARNGYTVVTNFRDMTSDLRRILTTELNKDNCLY